MGKPIKKGSIFTNKKELEAFVDSIIEDGPTVSPRYIYYYRKYLRSMFSGKRDKKQRSH